ncbi:hypothetical protein CPB86DRAFT_828324 [Serendipita vermifera]|nr:hypothetical protein CPB86DRAFT_828324 [Serendipita vermifera]
MMRLRPKCLQALQDLFSNFASTPKNLSNESETSLANALSRGYVGTAKSFIKPALGNKDALQIEKLLSLSDPRSPSNPEGYTLTNEQRLEFLQQLDIDASNMMKTLLKDSNCFTPNIKARIFSHFWLILDTRPFIRTLITLATLCEEMGQYQLAYDYGLRILTYNFVDNNGVRTNFNLLQTLLGRDLEAYNFSFDLLVQHLDWDGFERENRGKNYPVIIFDKFKKEDIDPQDPAIHGTSKDIRHADASLLFTGALALFKMFGHCPKATSWLAAGHHRNSHILPSFAP